MGLVFFRICLSVLFVFSVQPVTAAEFDSLPLSDLDSYIGILLDAHQDKEMAPLGQCRYPFYLEDSSMPYSVDLLLGEALGPVTCSEYQGIVMSLDGGSGETVFPVEEGLSEFVRGYRCSNGWEIMLNPKWSNAFVNYPDCFSEDFISQPELYR